MKINKKFGFTLVEMLIVIVIIGVLAAALIPRLTAVQGRARDAKRKADLAQIGGALAIYKTDNGSFPAATNTRSFDGSGGLLVPNYLNALPKDGDLSTWSGTILSRSNTGGYYGYTDMRRNGVDSAGMVLMARTESDGNNSNRNVLATSGQMQNTDSVENFEAIACITKMTFVTTNTNTLTEGNPSTDCRANRSANAIRYVYFQ